MAGLDDKTLRDFARVVLRGRAEQKAGKVQATFLRTDPDGTQWVQLAGSSEETPVNGNSLATAEAGDTVELAVSDGLLSIRGNASEPSVGVRGASIVAEKAVDVVRGVAEDAGRAAELSKKVADAAQRVASAVSQHFFADDGGIHVTEATQDDWDANHTGANMLLSSVGQLFRDGLNNLLTLTTEEGARALTVWDGLGNAASNIRAVIGETIQLGSTASGNYVTLDSSGMEIHNAANFGAKIAYDLVSLLSGSFTMQSEVEQSSGHSMESWVRHCSYIRHKFYSRATSPSINLYDQKTTNAETGTDSYSSGIMLNGDVKCMDGRITVVGGANGALIATDAGSVGISGDGTWVIRRDVNYGLVLGSGATDHLYHRESTVTVNTSNVTIDNGGNYVWNNGAVCSFLVLCHVKSALANGSELAVGTIPSGYRPPHGMAVEVYASTAARVTAKVDTVGNVTIRNVSGSSLATTTTLRISGTWAL